MTSKFNSRGDYPRSLNFGLPMNFEDMMNTGLSLAKQSQRLKEKIPRTTTSPPATLAPLKSGVQSWKMQQTDGNRIDPAGTKTQKSQSKERFQDFRPSKKTSQHKKPSVNTVDSSQIHIIGPNCYVMTNSGFKLVGEAELCREGKTMVRRTGPSSIWDSLKSLPIVNTFAKTLGMRQ